MSVKKPAFITLPVVIVGILIALPGLAGMSSANYQIPNDVISGGGSAMSSASYQLVGTIGQSSPLGTATSTSYTNYPGFWQADECVWDADSDGLVNAGEYGYGTNAYDADSDDDLLNDGEEVCVCLDGYTTDPLNFDTDSDNLGDGAEYTAGTIPKGANGFDTDRDGLGDGEEVYAGTDSFVTNPKNWDSDHDGLPDGYESAESTGNPENLDPTLAADGALDFDSDGILNADDYWNGAADSPWTTDLVGYLECGYWAESDGDSWITGNDRDMLISASIGNPTDYSNVYPNTGETQDIDGDGWFTGNDLDLIDSMMIGSATSYIQSRPAALETVATCPPTLAVGDTCHVSVAVLNSLMPTAGRQAGIPVVFTVDPSSTGSVTIFGGEGAGDLGGRYDLSRTILSEPAGLSRAVLRADTTGTVQISARVPQCGVEMGVGRSSPEIILSNFSTITVP